MPSLSKVLRCNSIQLLCYLRKLLVQIQRFHTDLVPAHLVDVVRLEQLIRLCVLPAR